MNLLKIVIIILSITAMCALSFWLCWYLFIPHELKMEYLEEVVINEEQSSTWWMMVKNPDNHAIADLNLDISDFDFTKNYLVISIGRPLKSITFNRISRFMWPYDKRYKGVAIFKNQLDRNKIYLYKSQKINCHPDDSTSSKIIVEWSYIEEIKNKAK